MRITLPQWLIPGAVLLGFATSLAAQTSRPTTASVGALIAQLRADRDLDRQHAQDRLAEMAIDDPLLLERLARLARESHDEETVSRAQAIVNEAAVHHLTRGTPINLDLREAPATDAFAKLSRQLGTEITTGAADPWQHRTALRVSMTADALPFWTAFVGLCKQAGVEPDFSDNGRFTLVESSDGKWARNPFCTSGPVLVQAVEITRTRSVELAEPRNLEDSAQLQLNVYLEPKLRFLDQALPVTIDVAEDEQGHSLLDDQSDEPAVSPVIDDFRQQWEATVPLKTSAQTGRRLAKLSGTVAMQFVTKTQPIEVDPILSANNVSRVAAGRRLVIVSATKEQGGYQVQATLFRDRLSDEQWRQWVSLQDFVRLEDAEGHRIACVGISSQSEGDETQSVQLHFENPNGQPNGVGGPVGPPAKLVWEIPISTQQGRFPFTFKDLPLP